MAQAQDPDGDLVRKIQQGDQSAFNQLVLKYRHRIMGVAARMLGDRTEAEDTAQDVFVKVYQSLKAFKGEALFSTWLYRITANSCLNNKRKHKDNQKFEDGEARAIPDTGHDPQTLFEEKERKLVLERVIRALPQDQKVVLILRDMEGLSYEAIAEALKLEIGTVKSRLHRARLQVQASANGTPSRKNRGNIAL